MPAPYESTAVRAPLEHSAPSGWVVHIGGRSKVPGYRPPWVTQQRTPAHPAAPSPSRPLADLAGCVTAYDRIVSDGRGGRELFLPRSLAAGPRHVPLLLEHRTPLGWVQLDDDGLLVMVRGYLLDAHPELPRRVGLSMGLAVHASRQEGHVTRVLHGTIHEVSVVPRAGDAAHRPYATADLAA